MNNWYSDDIRDLFRAIVTLETEEECRMFFEDVCTVREIIEIAQRLKNKVSYNTINRETGVSTATISRVSRCLDYGSGGYRLILERLEEGKDA